MLDFDLTVRRGSFELQATGKHSVARMGMFGPSGAGKTTLLHSLAGLVRPDAGFIRLGDNVLFDAARRTHVPAQRRQIGYVFQDGRLFAHMPVRKNIEYGRRKRQPPGATVDELVKVLDLADLLDRFPDTLSGGERQRVALARALAAAPQLLLLDEPLAAIDAQARLRIMSYLQRIYERWQLPFIFVSHSLTDVLFLTERVWRIEDGSLTDEMKPEELLTEQQHGRGDSLLNVLEGVVTDVPEKSGYAIVKSHQQFLRVPGSGVHLGDRVTLALAARDVMLGTKMPLGLSARNVLPATVGQLRSNGQAVWVTTDGAVGPVVVEMTEDAVRDLDLRAKMPVYLIFKTHAVRVAT